MPTPQPPLILVALCALSFLALTGNADSRARPIRMDADAKVVPNQQVAAQTFGSTPFVVLSAARVWANRVGLAILSHSLCPLRVERNRAEPLTLATLTMARAIAIPRPVSIRTRESVPVHTMCLRYGHRGDCRRSAQEVLPTCDRIKVPGVEARASAAKMVEMEPFRYGTDEKLIGDAMSPAWLAFPLDPTIAAAVNMAGPNPAAFDACELCEALSKIHALHRGEI